MEVLFENDSCIAIDKPALWLSVPSRDRNDPRKILGLELQKKLNQQVYPVHRLDYEASGLILFAKTPVFHQLLNSLFEKKQIQKTYQALSQKSQFQKGQKVEWKAKVLRGKKRTYESPHGKESLTVGYVQDELENFLDWRLQPVTGRSHQLRFDLARHESPILGDTLYGATAPWPLGIALKSIKLEFPEEFAKTHQLPQQLTAPNLTLATIPQE